MPEHPFRVGQRIRYVGRINGKAHRDIPEYFFKPGEVYTVLTAHWFERGGRRPSPGITIEEYSERGGGPNGRWQIVDLMDGVYAPITEYFVPDIITSVEDMDALYG